VSPREELAASPALYPFAIDQWVDAVQFLRLSESEYAAASFHDKRMEVREGAAVWRSWRAVRESAAGMPERCHFIFHISHVGSTLLSRLLGGDPSFFALREPSILRTLADIQRTLGEAGCPWSRAEFDDRLGIYLALWSRTFSPRATTVIKATSFVSEMSDMLVRRVPSSRAVCMFVVPQTFLAALLGGAMSDITGRAASRLQRVHARLGTPRWRLSDLSPGEAVAMSWLSEMLALRATREAFPDRVTWIDFDAFLERPSDELWCALRHLGSAATENDVAKLLSDQTMTRYSKAPQFEFNAGQRKILLEQAHQQHRSEIAKGLSWLESAASEFPDVRRAIQEAESHRGRPLEVARANA
jgi:hypothetical protein